MECIDAYVGVGRSFYCLFYEERAPGDHLSRVYWFADHDIASLHLICEVEEWLVSIWANARGELWGASWDGRIFRLAAEVTQVAATDLLGTIKLAGFSDEPDFLMGEDGFIFERKGSNWSQIKFRGSFDVYSVAQRRERDFWFVGSGGKLLKYENGSPSLERLPTNMDLHGIAFLDPDTGMIAGDEGVLLSFRSEEWTDITDDRTSLPDVHAFKGRFVLCVEGERIDLVSRDGNREASADRPGYYLSSNEQQCVTFYEEAAMVFDGESWTAVPFGELISEEIE